MSIADISLVDDTQRRVSVVLCIAFDPVEDIP